MKLHNKDFDEIFEVITFGYINSEVPNGNGDYPVEFVTLEVVDEEGDLYEFHYKSLKDLNVIWEDCTQKEPLIKDEKIRKAVRAWANVNGIGGCICKEEINCITFETERGMFISFENADPIPPEGNYTIAELCGEEE